MNVFAAPCPTCGQQPDGLTAEPIESYSPWPDRLDPIAITTTVVGYEIWLEPCGHRVRRMRWRRRKVMQDGEWQEVIETFFPDDDADGEG